MPSQNSDLDQFSPWLKHAKLAVSPSFARFVFHIYMIVSCFFACFVSKIENRKYFALKLVLCNAFSIAIRKKTISIVQRESAVPMRFRNVSYTRKAPLYNRFYNLAAVIVPGAFLKNATPIRFSNSQPHDCKAEFHCTSALFAYKTTLGNVLQIKVLFTFTSRQSPLGIVQKLLGN